VPLTDLFWLLLILSAITPFVQQKMLERARLRLMTRMEKKRNSRVIALIHRQETVGFLGIPILRYIDVHDSEEVLRAIRMTPPDMPIDFIVHTPGGLMLASELIARAIARHPAKVTVFVPHYAMSGGTLLALAADEIVMDENAVLGPIDPQLGEYPAASILAAVRRKPSERLDDRTLILADVAEKAIFQMRAYVKSLLEDKMGAERAEEMARVLTEGRWTHDYPITAEELRKLGLNVKIGLPEEVYMLMNLYGQPYQRRPSVMYVPIPYHRDESAPPARPPRKRGRVE